MNKEQVISQLKSLQRDAKSHIDKDDKNDVFAQDYEALDYAIKTLEDDNKKTRYELFFRVDGIESITIYKFKNKEDAINMRNSLNKGLKLSGYNDREYVLAKVTREYII